MRGDWKQVITCLRDDLAVDSRLTVRGTGRQTLHQPGGSLLWFVPTMSRQDRSYKGQDQNMMRRRTLVEMVVYKLRTLKLCRMNANGSTYW
jgi:hypothetical protein